MAMGMGTSKARLLYNRMHMFAGILAASTLFFSSCTSNCNSNRYPCPTAVAAVKTAWWKRYLEEKVSEIQRKRYDGYDYALDDPVPSGASASPS